MRPRCPSLDWIAKVLGEPAEARARGSRPALRLVSGGNAPAQSFTRVAQLSARPTAPTARLIRRPKPIADASDE
jgi:hypothetical protein